MKDKDKKKKGESTIGKIIYGFLLFAPLIAIGSTILINVFNKNAKLENKQEYEYVNIIRPEQNEHIYCRSYNANAYSGQELLHLVFEVDNFKYINGENQLKNIEENVNKIELYRTANQQKGYLTQYFYNGNTNLFSITSNVNVFEFDFVGFVNNPSDNLLLSFQNIFSKKQYNEIYPNSNAFYYAIDKVEESSIFNWTKNTAIYTGINATSNTLGITNTFIPMLLTYWLIISILYFLYDIILMGLNILHKKIHELQDSF